MSFIYCTIFLTKKGASMQQVKKSNGVRGLRINKENRPWRNNGQFTYHRFKEKLD